MLNRHPTYKVLDFLEFLFGIVSFFSGLLSIWAFIEGKVDSLTIFTLFAISAIFLAAFWKLLKFRQVATNRLRGFSGAFHSFTDTLRDDYYNMMSLYVNGKLTPEQLTIMAESTCQTAVDLIATTLSESTGEKVCVSIKYFPRPVKNKSIKNIDIDDYMLATLCRSTNSPQERHGHRLMRVGDNSGFQAIIKYQNNHFRAQDLERYIQDTESSGFGGFRTTNPNWRNFYKSLITVPIRINRTLLPPPRKATGGGYHIIGLLCADSMSTSAFRSEDEMNAYTNYLKSYADALYIYLERVDFYMGKLTSKKLI